MYMLITGRVRVFDPRPDGGEKIVADLEPGSVFGEMALVTGRARTASVVAISDVEVLRLDFAALERVRRRFPYTGAKLFRNLAAILADRLRRTTDMALAAGVPPSAPATAAPAGLAPEGA
jgi:CRP-like cAMP-binding protein